MSEPRRWIAKGTWCALLAALVFLCGCDSFYGGDAAHPLFRKAVALRAAGDYEDAARTLKKFLLKRPDSAKAHLTLAAILDENLHDMVGALYHYREILRLAPDSTEASDVKAWMRNCELRLQSSLAKDALSTRLQTENSRLRQTVAQYHRRVMELRSELEKTRADLSAAKTAAAEARQDAERAKEAAANAEKAVAAAHAKVENTPVPPTGAPAGSVPEKAPETAVAEVEKKTVASSSPSVSAEKPIEERAEAPLDPVSKLFASLGLSGETPAAAPAGAQAVPPPVSVPEKASAAPAEIVPMAKPSSPDPLPAPKPPEEKKAAPAPAEWPKTYVVRSGDSLSAISRRFYGTSRLYRHIMEANKISNTKHLAAGQTIILPAPPAKEE